jgi:P27 family predicted phage terminase small subunit
MAPPAKPVELKRRLGNPGKRPLQAGLVTLSAVPVNLDPPETLGDEGAGEWRHVLANCRWISPSDLRNLRLYCEALDRRSLLLAEVASQGHVLYTDKGYAYLNPAVGALATVETQITKWLSLLGLTPSDRSRLGVAEVKAQSTLELLAAKRTGRQGS